MFLCISNLSVAHVVLCNALSESESWSGKTKAFFAKYTSLYSCSSASFDCSALNGAAGESHWVPWSTKIGFRIAAEVMSLLVEIGGFCSLQFSFWRQFAIAVSTTSFAFGVQKLTLLLTHLVMRISFFRLYLSRVLILLISVAPLSSQALVIGADRVTSAS